MKRILVGISFSLLFSSMAVADFENGKSVKISVEKIDEQVSDDEILKKIEEIVSNKKLTAELLPVTKKFFVSICNENRKHFNRLSKDEKMECYATILYALALLSNPENYDGIEAKKRFNNAIFQKVALNKDSKILKLKDFFDKNGELYSSASKTNLKALKAKVLELSETKSVKKRTARMARVSKVTVQKQKVTRASRNANLSRRLTRIDKQTIRRGRHQKGSNVYLAEINQVIKDLDRLLG